ncbi:orotidine 5'-phosphate decarboxylase, partial [Striga asiatica]
RAEEKTRFPTAALIGEGKGQDAIFWRVEWLLMSAMCGDGVAAAGEVGEWRSRVGLDGGRRCYMGERAELVERGFDRLRILLGLVNLLVHLFFGSFSILFDLNLFFPFPAFELLQGSLQGGLPPRMLKW